MKYKLAVFDMDGTILDTLEDLWRCLNHVLEENGYPSHTLEEVRFFVGNGIYKLIERALPDGCTPAETRNVYQQFLLYYKEHCAEKTRPYEGVVELLRELRQNGCLTAVVSNKADEAVQELCEQYFPGLFDAAEGDREGILRKPAPDLVNLILDKLSVSRQEAVYIGDSDVDLATADNSQMDCIAVTWGFRDKDFLWEHGAQVLADRPEQVLKLILG